METILVIGHGLTEYPYCVQEIFHSILSAQQGGYYLPSYVLEVFDEVGNTQILHLLSQSDHASTEVRENRLIR